MWLTVLVSVVTFVVYLIGIKPYQHWAKKGIPYIKPVPLFGNFVSSILQTKSLADELQGLYNTYPDQRYVGVYQFLHPILLVRDPDLIKQITVKEFDVFPEHRAFAPDDVDPLWSKNLFQMKGGAKWHDMRTTLSPSFTSSKMKMMFNLMKTCSKQFVQHFQKDGKTVTIEMKDAFTRFTNDVIATSAFGVDCDSLSKPNNEFYLMGKDVTDFSGLRNLKLFMGMLSLNIMKILNIGILTKEASTFFRSIIKQTLEVREKHKTVRPDMVHLLMEARKGRLTNDQKLSTTDSGFAVVQESVSTERNSKPEKPQITDEDITAHALIFFLAGFDTASTFMCFTAYELAVNPDIQAKLREEIDETYENASEDINYESLLGMKYLDMVVTEALRKWPPVTTLDRMSVKPFTIQPTLPGEKSVTLEKGTNVWIPTYSVHRDPQNYPEPDKFDPERFSEKNKHKIKPFTYLPFGSGPRNCIGSRFALLEGKLVIAEIVRNFEIVPVEKTPIPMKLDKRNFTPLAENGFWLALKPRKCM